MPARPAAAPPRKQVSMTSLPIGKPTMRAARRLPPVTRAAKPIVV
jgi:hypothetical protein